MEDESQLGGLEFSDEEAQRALEDESQLGGLEFSSNIVLTS